MKSLQTRIFVFFVLLLLMVQAIAFWTMYQSNKTDEQLAINNRLSSAEALFNNEFDARRFYLDGFAETVSLDYGLINNFDEDNKSLALALNNHRRRINADLAMVINQQGIIRVQLVTAIDQQNRLRIRSGSQQKQSFTYLDALEQNKASPYYPLNNELYQISFSPIKTGPATIGWIGFGFRIDSRFANTLSESTNLQIDFIKQKNNQWMNLGSSSSSTDMSLTKAIINQQQTDQVIARTLEFAQINDNKYFILIYGNRDDFVALLQNRWLQLLLLTAITLFLSLLGAYIIAASITRPVKALVTQAKKMARGDYNQPVAIKDKSELGQLANEFNSMQQAILTREQTITHRAYHDQLTNMPNRNMLKLTLKQLGELEQAFCLLHLNVSRLKDVNDTLGHEAGDQVIKEVGKRLSGIKNFNLVSHIGADEFAIICITSTQDNIQTTIEVITEALHENFCYQNISLQLQAHIGIAFYPEHQSDTLLLLQKADTALHYSKSQRQAYKIYDPEQDSNTVERLNLINDLKSAIDDNQLTLFYQPKFNFNQQRITHAEALVRWFHPTLGMIPPDKFIHLAEQTGQINALTQSVFNQAVEQHKQWLKQGIIVNIAINISAENLKDPNFYDFVCDTLTKHQIAPDNFTLEITESAVVDDPESAIDLLSRFKDRGFHLSIDDYGTGYSSLAQLKHLPVHELKIDKSFVMRLASDDDDKIIVRSTIELAQNMGLTIVAEGVEDEQALAWLAQHQCTLAQGYFISRPIPADEFSTWFKQENNPFMAMSKEA